MEWQCRMDVERQMKAASQLIKASKIDWYVISYCMVDDGTGGGFIDLYTYESLSNIGQLEPIVLAIKAFREASRLAFCGVDVGFWHYNCFASDGSITFSADGELISKEDLSPVKGSWFTNPISS